MKKLFVLDTNVILHDASCAFHFQDNDVVVPITVIEELDNFKKGHDQLNFNAREFIRFLDKFSGKKIINGGESLGKGRGKILILTNYSDAAEVREAFVEKKPDHRILSAALFLKRTAKKTKVIFVSKDVNLRLKAKSLGLETQDYYTDKIEDIEKLYRGIQRVEKFDPALIDRLYRENSILVQESGIQEVQPNEYFILRNGAKSGLAYFNPNSDMLEHVDKGRAYGIKPRNAEQTFSLHALMNIAAPLVTLSGKAGTGKTLLALASALERRKAYKQIYLARPVVALSNRDLGYLPGDIEAKLDPYMQPLYDNLGVIKNQFNEEDKHYKLIQEMLDAEKLVIAPLAYIRGRSLNDIYFIVDEAQNLTPHEVKTIITRAGEGSKVVFTGDPYQIDTPYLDSRSNGLTYLIDRMKGQPLYAHVTLQKGERSELAELASDLL